MALAVHTLLGPVTEIGIGTVLIDGTFRSRLADAVSAGGPSRTYEIRLAALLTRVRLVISAEDGVQTKTKIRIAHPLFRTIETGLTAFFPRLKRTVSAEKIPLHDRRQGEVPPQRNGGGQREKGRGSLKDGRPFFFLR